MPARKGGLLGRSVANGCESGQFTRQAATSGWMLIVGKGLWVEGTAR